MKSFRLSRIRPAKRPPPFPIERIARESLNKPGDRARIVVLPELELTLATPFTCGACDGARTDFVTQTRETDRAYVPCRLCQGEGAILPGEHLIVDIAAAQVRIDQQLLVQSYGRLRSPWAGAEKWHDTLCWSAPHGGIASTALLEGALVSKLIDTLLNSGRVFKGPHYPFGIRGFSIREFRFTTPLTWPASWEMPPRDDLSWSNLAVLEAEMTR